MVRYREIKKAGIEIEVGLLKEVAEELNEQFYTFHKKTAIYFIESCTFY